jgi:hypothetical protein
MAEDAEAAARTMADPMSMLDDAMRFLQAGLDALRS